MNPTIYVLIGVLTITSTMGVKILLYPSNINSHLIYFGRLADVLSQEGHSTAILVPSNAKPPKTLMQNAEVITYAVPAQEAYHNSPQCSALFVEASLAETILQMITAYSKMGYDMQAAFQEDCDALFQNDELMRELAEAEYDLVVVDTMLFTGGYTLPYKFNVPHVSFSIPNFMWKMRVPGLPSFVPSVLMTDYTDRMTFLQRLNNVFRQLIGYSMVNTTDYFIKQYVPEKPRLTSYELMQKSSLYFVLRDLTVSYPGPTMPNIIDMGDIMARPAQPLPDDLKRYMDVSERGVILISFGSYIDHLPSEITCKIAQALSRLEYNAIWRVNQEMLKCHVASNVKVMPWIPQNDLLGHINMKLFISHCGFNSIMEAVYHAVPVLAIPLSIDQPFNAKVVETHGYGLKLDFKSFTVDDLVNAAETIISNMSYKDNISKASNILRDRPQSPAKRASFWINHVVKYGGDHLRTKAFELTVFEFFMLDIFVFVSVVLIIATVLFLCCCKLAYKPCCSKICKDRKSKSKQE